MVSLTAVSFDGFYRLHITRLLLAAFVLSVLFASGCAEGLRQSVIRSGAKNRTHTLSQQNRVLFDMVPGCVPAGENHMLTEAKLQRCPCFVSFGLSSKAKSSVVVDFMVMHRGAYERWKNRSFEGALPSLNTQFSAMGKRAETYSFVYDNYFFQTENMELEVDNDFAFVVRTSAVEADCALEVMHIFESQPSPCPMQLPESGEDVSIADLAGEERASLSTVGTSSGSNNVVAGSPVTDEIIRSYMVALRSSAGSCSGTVVGAEWILTAAHCQVRPGGTAFVGGETSGSGAVHAVAEFIAHPLYRAGVDNATLEMHDIAVVRVQGRVRGGEAVMLSTEKDGPGAGMYARASGYGQTAEGWNAGRVRGLLQVDVPTVGFAECVRAFVRWGAGEFGRGLAGEGHLCAGFVSEGCGGDTCYGDSGGPLVMREREGERLVQVGVVSGGIGCARKGLPGVYTRVGKYFEWVEKVTNGSVRAGRVGGVDETIGEVVGEEEEVGDGGSVARSGLVVALVAVGAGVAFAVGLFVWWAVRRRRKRKGWKEGDGEEDGEEGGEEGGEEDGEEDGEEQGDQDADGG